MKQKSFKTKLDLAGVLKSLKTQETPWKEKIRLAHRLLQGDCLFPNKLQIILDWACQELVFNSAHKCYPTEMLQELWQIIVELLQTIKSKNKANHLSLRISFIEVVVKEFQEPGLKLSSFIECCRVMFSTEEFYKPIVSKFEKFMNFLASVLKYSHQLYDVIGERKATELEEEKDLIAAYFALVDVLLKLFVKLLKNQPNIQKLTVSFNEKLIQEIAVWKNVLSKFVKRTESSWSGTSSRELLEKSLWNSQNIMTIKGHMHLWGVDETTNEHFAQKFALLDSLFSSVARCVNLGNESDEDRLVSESMLAFVPEQYEAFLKANRNASTLPRHFEFTLFKRFCALIFPQLDKIKSCVAMANCLNQLLNVMVQFNVFKVNDDSINTDANKSFLQNLTKLIIRIIKTGTPEFNIILLQCVQHLVDIDRSLFDSYIQDILKELLAPVKNEGVEDSNELLEKSKCSLFRFIMDNFAKARQIEEFLKELVISVRESLSHVRIDSFVFDRLKEIMSSLSVGQSLSVTDALLNEMTEEYIEKLKDFVISEDITAAELKGLEGEIRKLSLISEMFSICMLNTRVLPMNGYIGDNQESYLSMVKRLQLNILLVVKLFAKIDQKYATNEVLKLAWRLVLTQQRISLYLLHHGIIDSPILPHPDFLEVVRCLATGSKESTDGCSKRSSSLFVKNLILHLQQMILISDEGAVNYCCYQLDEFILGCLDTSELVYRDPSMLSVTATIVEELPWLCDYIRGKSVSILGQVMFDVVMKQSQKDFRVDQVGTSTDYDKNDSEVFSKLIMSPVFYDNEAIQTAFCDLLPKKTWSLLKESFTDGLKATLERSIECLKSSGDHNIMESSQSEDGTTLMDISLPETDGRIDGQFEDACDNIITTLLGISSMRATYTPDKEETETITHVLQTDVHALLKVIGIMNFEWLSAENAARLIVSIKILLFRIVFLLKPCDDCGKADVNIFYLLERFTSSTIISNRLNVWKLIDPVLLLQYSLCMVERLVHQNSSELPDVVYLCIQNIWYLVLNVKRSRTGESVFESIKLKMLKIAEELARNPDEASVRVFYALTSVVLNTIQNKIVKRRALTTGLELIYPIVEQMLGDVSTESRVLVEHKFTEEKVKFLVLRCYCNLYSICLMMKIAGKDERFISLVEGSMLEEMISNASYDVRDILLKAENEFDIEQSMSLKFEVCLEFLQMISSFENCQEVDQLQRLDFSGSVFSCLCSILEKSSRGKGEWKLRTVCYQVMANLICHGKEIVAEHLLNELIFRTRSALHNRNALLVHMRFFCYLLGLKGSKDNKKKFAELLPKVMYICIEVINNKLKENEENLLMALYECITTIVAFPKGVLMPSLAVASIHCVVDKSQATYQYRNPKLLQLKVKLLSELLFNHSSAVFGAIASFLSGINYLLTELVALNQPKSAPSAQDALRACESIGRLYQELASHKDFVARYAPYLVADYLQIVTSKSIPQEYQKCLTDGLYCLMDSCSSNDSAYLNMALSQGERELFKDLYKTFVKHHKFSGKA
ncbi:uncharacterized protein LOC135693959 isoform X2 [Rhopilema esculentum]|uniref:uncharacterized protein LOC135693959 isoform X2 n=1 Tax=Rhopilema esculentum TaxID=499914 RepID=UPI0031D10032